MTLALYGHAFSSYTQKVLIALYENATPHTFCGIGPDTPEHTAEWLRRWPLRKFPLRAYAWFEGQLAGKTWAAGADFSLADFAAAPSLFYADWTFRITEHFPLLRAYRAHLLARPSFARAVGEARYFRPHFPLGAPDCD